MKMDTSILKRAGAQSAALDFSEENARIAEVTAEIDRTEAAITTAEQRCTEISRELVDYRGPNASAVAEAMLSGVAPAQAAAAAPNRAELEAERGALRSGIRELRQRVEDLQAEVAGIQRAAFLRVRPAVQEVVKTLTDEARAAAQKIIDAAVALDAIAYATKQGDHEAGAVRRAAAGVIGQDRLIPGRRDYPVPPEIVSLLQNLAGKRPALPARFVSDVEITPPLR
ncbi:hypothetical protein H0274_13690 [Altererythrobacter sp. CC-YST694]|uniref:hypothetical protein n=1 Tax=Altererythrobacter sp. CC-YST694 TaxID=2755038 RepID=UPI001D003616|nr:hypothetical protein [Altererythrobacter sp. CC-YST694]MCB5426315.1 hypothetical protein [Altererythrobacter sp. CC-YST694]